MPQKPETLFRKKVRKELEKIPNSFWESIQQKVICGTPDILGCVNGVFVGIEIKSKTGKLSVLQSYKLDLISRAGGIAICLSPKNLEETLAFLNRLMGDV